MTLRAKVRGEWRIVSKAMARRFRARGVEVLDDANPVEVIGDLLVKAGDQAPPAEVIDPTNVDQQSFAAAAATLRQDGAAEPTAPALPVPDSNEPPPAAPTSLAFTSSNVRAAELGADGVLIVAFANGKSCAYANFTPELMLEWQAAKSAGGWFHANVRSKPDRHPVIGSQAAPGGGEG